MIKVNGRDSDWEENLTVEKLLQNKRYTYPKIIVRINGELINREEYASTPIRDGDDVKVIHLLAGG
ncbi:sulfur carrier protein ThiS [Geosporobacter ferrireducens]|uniref:Thiamine biosynthesis protein ThiS n=1 Tax=Geosporobacter ferrireducens TaxID=1424294 RepID=A0A1D8GBB7_9FIRM|nr:sulfur carrier protein ThiS [Geosporobacter ferrireducens]AOT68204.1 thiamine biosynthesis protein ThiS [Geosporobacter ferrireducens]